MTTSTLTLNNGVELPAVGLGVYQTPPEETVTAVRTALEVGYRHIDTAAAYGNEREVGEAIRRSGVSRAEIFIETKVWPSDYGFEQTLHAFDKSAAKLGVDQIDLHPYNIRPDLQAADAEHGILTQAWAPIGGIRHYNGDSNTPLADRTIAEIGEAHGKSTAQVMLNWHVQQGRSAIPKSVHPGRIAENFDVFDFTLTPDELARIDALNQGDTVDPDQMDFLSFGIEIPEA